MEHRLELADNLLQHQRKVHAGFLQLHVGEVEAGNLKELVDQLLQPLRLFQRHPGVVLPRLSGELRLFLQKGEIANHAGQRGFQVMGKVHNHIVFPLLRLLGGPGMEKGLLAYLV